LIAAHPYCSVCGITEEDAQKKGGFLTGHHRESFHEHPELELEPDNIEIICETRGLRDCHFLWGHLGISWAVNNPHVREMAAAMLKEVMRADK